MPAPKKPVHKPEGTPKKPKFRDKHAEQFWAMAAEGREQLFSEIDSALLALACDAWSRYQTTKADYEADPENWKREASMTRWFDRVYRMLGALGMTPAQRKNLPMPEGPAGPEARPSDLD